MCQTTPHAIRSKLGFAEEVLKAFDFLTEIYGCKLVNAEPTLVRYECPNSFVNIFHGRSSYELGVEFGRPIDHLNNQEERFSIGEVLELNNALQAENYSVLQASTPEGVKELVPTLAKLVKKYADSALRGDPHTFQQLSLLQKKNSDDFLHELN